ncbi:hypothetical protein ACOME3_004978 [Neoechinorhynchus agilis]
MQQQSQNGFKSREPSSPNSLYVVKRDLRKQNVMFDKITSRISKLCYGLNMEYVDPAAITLKVIAGLYPGVSTVELDNLAAEISATMTVRHPDYAVLAARIAVSNLHKETIKSFSEVIERLYVGDIGCADNKQLHRSIEPRLISEKTYQIVMANADRLNSAIVHDRDFNFNYFGFKTLERSYLLRLNDRVIERPQHLLMRVAVGIHGEDIDSALETYRLMSEKWFTHATPTLFNAGTVHAQLSSCFLLTMVEDSIDGIYETLKRCALISKSAGGIGLSVHNIRAKGTYIAGTNGFSNGIIPMLRVFDATARYVDQGGNKRPGAFAVYLEPWHADVFEFIDMRKNRGAEELRGRDLFYALWVPDLFMKRIEQNGNWTLMCPHECPGLHECWGEEFERLYEQYEREGRGKRTIPARQLWYAVVEAQIETGNPFMVYKDACNAKSNQQHLGTIKSSNLCTEIVQYSSRDEVAVCNLASIALNKFVVRSKLTRKSRISATNANEDPKIYFDFDRLIEVVAVVVRNLNKIIEINYYPIKETRTSNLRHRPIGLGVQGLADTFVLMRLPFDCEQARELNKSIFETIYYAAVRESCNLAKTLGFYESFKGSPMSRGVFQFDMWGIRPSSRYDWEDLRSDVQKYGLRNSLLIAPMPTASTAQILGNNESIEPYTSNIYSRRVLSGEFQIVNPHLLSDLIERDLWDDNLRQQLMHSNGSIQHIEKIPDDLKLLYRTVWEIPQRSIIDMASDRGAFIDQSQSLNLHLAEPNYAKISSMHFYGWKKGLKTGMYYLRSKPASDPIKFTLDKSLKGVQMNYSVGENEQKCSLNNALDEICFSCSS